MIYKKALKDKLKLSVETIVSKTSKRYYVEDILLLTFEVERSKKLAMDNCCITFLGNQPSCWPNLRESAKLRALPISRSTIFFGTIRWLYHPQLKSVVNEREDELLACPQQKRLKLFSFLIFRIQGRRLHCYFLFFWHILAGSSFHTALAYD